MIFQKAGRRRLIRRWLVAELAFRSKELAEEATQRQIAERFAKKPRWTLSEALAWVATRLFEALSYGDGDGIGVSVWIAYRSLKHGPLNPSLPSIHEAWEELTAAMARGSLIGLATHTKETRDGGRVFHRIGVSFPPADQPGFPLQCVVHGGRSAIVAPAGWRGHIEWDQFQDVSFAREDMLRVFPLLIAEQPSAIDTASLTLAETAPISRSTKQSDYARKLAKRAFGEDLKVPGDMRPVAIVKMVLDEVQNGDGRPAPSRPTILRALGRQ